MIDVRGLGKLNSQLADHPYGGTLTSWANTAYAHDRNALDQYGPHWAAWQRLTGPRLLYRWVPRSPRRRC